ncbi:type 2 lanthipeptide synthetase LanM [Enterococcus sp. RIT-PI-f]|uniref:type 2 lanthipeptide synthetase LanM n=1 Tax=Enterococcus sp. RIT-PI-f TaxID=1690244 RepID=UPI0006B98709|nr:type 2 lanthipeptide synthetase LanM [Enterococcus sp. RIT-PI-f]KPG69958.1 hypothetical protein AEQ18_11105 [Enterococcus sp. RIT-PI-f]
MDSILLNALTIDEKLTGYKEGIEIDFTALEEWRNVRSLLKDKHFEEMLDITGTTREAFAYALEPQHKSSTHVNDSWYDLFEEIMTCFDYDSSTYSEGAYILSTPFVKYLFNDIEMMKKTLKNVKIEQTLLHSIAECLLNELFQINGKLLAKHLEEYKNNYELKSKTAKGRMKEYIRNNFSSKEMYLRFFEKYPVAARLMTIRTQYFHQNITELFQRIEDDASDIIEFLSINEINLTDIELSSGDSHAKGKSVAILHISGRKLVYKPKNLEIALAFETLFDWLVRHSALLKIKLPKGIYKETHTYNEFIQAEPCQSKQELEGYYQRYGQLVAICYLLGVNDVHLENITACGEHPIIIDIETAFQNKEQSYGGRLLYRHLEKILINDSVLNSALLPQNLPVGMNDCVDLSGLSGKQKAISQEVDHPINLYMDTFRFEKKKAKFQNGHNLPMLIDRVPISYKKYSLKIIEGFECTLVFILENKEAFLETLKCFRGHRIRLLLKGTERYGVLLRYSNHPTYNQKMKYRERLFMNIWSYPYKDKRIIKSEVADLIVNDIPIFFSRTDSRSIIDSQGNEYIDYFKKSGYDHMQDRVKSLSLETVNQQKRLIYSSLGVFDQQNSCPLKSQGPHFTSMYFDKAKAARRIGDNLLEESFIKGEQLSFLTVDITEQKRWKVSPCDESLYSGLSGIAVFFLELYQSTKNKYYLDAYRKILHTAICQSKFTPISSAFNGRLSPLYPIILGYRYLGETNAYVDELFKMLAADIENTLNKISDLDYLTGLAGIVRLFCLMEDGYPYVPFFEEVKDKVISSFLGKYHINSKSISATMGIAHGLSGIALAFSSLKTVHEAEIVEALEKDFSALKVMKDRKKWCRGISGMIQARIEILAKYSNARIQEQLISLIQQFKHTEKKIVNKDCLCHGNSGSIVTINMIAKLTKDPYWADLLQLRLSNLYMEESADKPRLPIIMDLTSKGIFDGISGTGWVYLYCQNSISNIMLLKSESSI